MSPTFVPRSLLAPCPATLPRDGRLDVFRGLAMFIIFIAHMPGNVWALWMPGRFGFSDATEIFVFCSGMASAIAFGRAFDRHGWSMGTARIAHRVWQLYWAHLGLFFALAGLMALLGDAQGMPRDYVGQLNLYPFFKDPQTNLVGLLTLTYVPNYFDILPMYIVVLALVPVVMALARIHLGLAALFVTVTWAIGTTGAVGLPAEPWSQRAWFFNPFAWQLVFFTGFAFARGWITPPPVERRFVVAALAVVLLSLPLAYFRILNAMPALRELADILHPLTTKTGFGILRYVHFLALAYLAWVAVGPAGCRLHRAGWTGQAIEIVRKVGQQSLPIFLAGMVLARLGGVALDLLGRNALTVPLVNLAGLALLVATAYLAAWFKAQPWRGLPAARPTEIGLAEPAAPVEGAPVR